MNLVRFLIAEPISRLSSVQYTAALIRSSRAYPALSAHHAAACVAPRRHGASAAARKSSSVLYRPPAREQRRRECCGPRCEAGLRCWP
eukprot:6178920-Pleurochrysis_carterae.AAC.2